MNSAQPRRSNSGITTTRCAYASGVEVAQVWSERILQSERRSLWLTRTILNGTHHFALLLLLLILERTRILDGPTSKTPVPIPERYRLARRDCQYRIWKCDGVARACGAIMCRWWRCSKKGVSRKGSVRARELAQRGLTSF